MSENIIFYGAHLIGTDHIKEGLPCQDYHKIIKLDNGWVISAIADGVGSAAHSEVGSHLAVEKAIEYFSLNANNSNIDSDLETVLKKSFQYAYEKICIEAEENSNNIEDYDTTLTVVVFDGMTILYGHIGDGGIIVLKRNGKYDTITKPDKGADGESVIPLRFGEKFWNFGIIKDDIVSVLMATDGLLDDLFKPKVLKHIGKELYISQLRIFMDKEFNGINEETPDELSEELIELFETDKKYTEITSDDKTMIVMISNLLEAKVLEDSYYSEPDWEFIDKKIKETLYSPFNNK